MSKTAQISQIAGKIDEYRDVILTGKILSIDPSVGSASSMPGYAIAEEGILVESGLIKLPIHLPLHLRLAELGRVLREDFESPDLIILEYIGGYAFGPLRYNINAYHSLIKAAGVASSATYTEKLIEVPPSVWKKYTDEDYVKGDEADAVYLLKYVLMAAKGTLPEPKVFERKPKKPRVPRKSKVKQKKTRSK